jgi:NMD protein affecting ribosome stability and mRNA decay
LNKAKETPSQALVGFCQSCAGELHYYITWIGRQDASGILECCLLAKEALGGTKYASPVH